MIFKKNFDFRFNKKINLLEIKVINKYGNILISFIITFIYQFSQFLLFKKKFLIFNPFLNLNDLILNFIIIYLLLIIFYSILLVVISIYTLLTVTFLKYYFIREDIYVGDLTDVVEVFFSVSTNIKLVFILLILIYSFIFIFFFKIYNFKKRTIILSFFLILFLSIINFKPLSNKFFLDNKYIYNFEEKANFRKNGIFFSIIQNYLISKNTKKLFEIYKKNNLSTNLFRKFNLVKANSNKKNIYIVIKESYFFFHEDQYSFLPNEIIEFYSKYNINKAIAPTFGGNSVASEYEIMCGNIELKLFQTLSYNRFGKNQTNCFPNYLKNYKYNFFSINGIEKFFFNMENVYKSFDSDKSYFKKDIKEKYNDFDGLHLSDESIYKFALEKIQNNLKFKKSSLYLINTNAGHYPFDLNKNKRKIIYFDKNKQKENFINRVYYSTKELIFFLKKLKEIDSNSIVLIIPDHIPKVNFMKYNNKIDLYTNKYIFLDNFESIKLNTVAYHEFPNLIINTLNKDKLLLSENFITNLGKINRENNDILCSYDDPECKDKNLKNLVNNNFETLFLSNKIN